MLPVLQKSVAIKKQDAPLQYSCLENPMDGGAWWAAVHGVAKSWTERLHFHFSLSCVGEGNGNPLQCSCLENPRDGGAWRATVYGIAQSRTRLKRLSSSSSLLLSNLVIYVGRLYLCKVIHNYYVTSTVLRSLHSFIIHNFLSVKLMRYLLTTISPTLWKKRKRQNMYDCIT